MGKDEERGGRSSQELSRGPWTKAEWTWPESALGGVSLETQQHISWCPAQTLRLECRDTCADRPGGKMATKALGTSRGRVRAVSDGSLHIIRL